MKPEHYPFDQTHGRILKIRRLTVFPTLPFLHIHEPKENNRGAEASTLSMDSCGQMAMNTHGGFTPALWLPPKYDKLRTGNMSLSLSAGAEWGDRHCPLLHRTSGLYFIY
jgi:hypothetical protein